jgi:DNA-binding response OmpR family regulator
MPHAILLVEDDAATVRMVRPALEGEGLTLLVAGSGPAGERMVLAPPPPGAALGLAIIDIQLPGFDGLELCRRIRLRSTLPILLLTARSTDLDKVLGLGLGADDYLTKPFSPTELAARVKALLRRAYDYRAPAPAVLLGGPRLRLDPQRHQASLDGRVLELTVTEFRLLQTLLEHPGWAFTRDHLLDQVWGFTDAAGEDTVTAHISNLRRKLGPDGGALIRTVRGLGYAYEEDV